MSQYHVFISHSSKDKAHAIALAKDLAAYEYKVWFDSQQIEGGEDWIKEIEAGVDNSLVIIVIWTENAKNSKWVEREIARADDKNKAIIPLIYDDTPVNSIILQRIQHIDFRKSYHTPFSILISRLIPLTDNQNIVTSDKSLIWEPQKRPFLRSRFLEENNYLDRQSPDFARNNKTGHLFDRNGQKAMSFLTLIAVPIPENIDFDISTLPEFSERKPPFNVKIETPTSLAHEFRTLKFSSRQTTQTDEVFYELRERTSEINMRNFLRFNEDGGIEFGESYASIYKKDSQIGFNFIVILASVWKFLFFASTVYKRNKYEGKYQLLINLVNTKNTTIFGFAQASNDYRIRWLSRFDDDPIYFVSLDETNQGIANDTNIQFVYNIDIKQILRYTENGQDIILDLSAKLQKAFNYRFEPRHYAPKTEEFPWHQLRNYSLEI